VAWWCHRLGIFIAYIFMHPNGNSCVYLFIRGAWKFLQMSCAVLYFKMGVSISSEGWEARGKSRNVGVISRGN
jgi:hypothetical protein